jgi:hypothetical chaperone protein
MAASGNLTLGIDFGTSNSAAAVLQADGKLHAIALEGERTSLPTALFFHADDGHVEYGSAALAAYLSGAEGRLMRSIKSLLGSKLMDEQTVINGRATSFFDIVVLFFKELKSRSEKRMGHTVTSAVLGRPVHFVDGDAKRDALAQATLGRAAKAAGFKNVTFQFEPVAAALDYERRVEAETTALVVDIGGGTSDFTVTRLGPARRNTLNRAKDVLATTGIHIAGTDFDRLINLDRVMPLLGYGHVGPSGREVPSGVFFDLSTWHLIHHAYARKSVHHAQELWTDYTDLALHKRLMRVLNEHQGHRLLAHVEAAKIACSVCNADTAIDVACIGDDLQALLSPAALELALHAQLEKIVACAQQCVSASGLPSVDTVYLTGGSSALRPLMDALQRVFPAASMVQGDLFGGVAAGLAYSGAL